MVKQTWSPVHTDVSVCVKGGYLRKSVPVEVTQIITAGGGELTMVKCSKNCEWLYKGACGPEAANGWLKRTQLIETLRMKYAALQLADTSATADQDVHGPVAVATDAMMELDDVVLDTPVKGKRAAPKQRQAATKRQRRPRYKSVGAITMPEIDPESHPNVEQHTRVVRVITKSTNQLWIALDDVPWLLNWLKDEFERGSVPLTDKTGTKLDTNCDVEGVHVAWDFCSSWEATFLDETAALRGKSLKSDVQKLTQQKFAVADEVHKYGCNFAEASAELKKDATRHFLLIECKKRIDDALLAAKIADAADDAANAEGQNEDAEEDDTQAS
jgi:hypothetical protein